MRRIRDKTSRQDTAPHETKNGSLITVENLKKYFPVHTENPFRRHIRYVKAVDGVTFNVARAETLGLVGESGCGKTTTGRVLLRLEEPTGGTFSFNGESVFDLKKEEMRRLRRRMQIIFQDPFSSLNPRQTVGSIISEAMRIHHVGSRGERVRLRRARGVRVERRGGGRAVLGDRNRGQRLRITLQLHATLCRHRQEKKREQSKFSHALHGMGARMLPDRDVL